MSDPLERQRDAAIAKHDNCGRCGAFLTIGGEQCVRENDHKGLHYFENDFAPTDEALRLRAEVARLKAGPIGRLGLRPTVEGKSVYEWIASHNREKQAREAAEARLRDLRLHYLEAIEDIEEWGGYASSYFQNKHDLAGTVAGHRKALSKSGEP
jgi:hypothetical protein